MTKIEIYVRQACPYCVMAKKLLASKGQDWEEIDLDEEPDRADEMIERSGGRMTVPEIFINNDLLGVGIWALGYDNGHEQLWGAISDKFSSSIIGDVNLDNIVNILDVITIVNIILTDTDYIDNADLNQDQIINIIDVIALINIILS